VCGQRTLELDLVLDDKGVVLVVNGLGELGRDGVVGSLVLDDETLVSLHALEDRGLLGRPGADVGPLLVVGLDILLCVRGLPAVLPVVCELLEEGRLESGGLGGGQQVHGKATRLAEVLTVKVGFATEADDSAGLASSARTTAAARAAVAPMEKRIVDACWSGESRGLGDGS
jgi:hypothetical protein